MPNVAMLEVLRPGMANARPVLQCWIATRIPMVRSITQRLPSAYRSWSATVE